MTVLPVVPAGGALVLAVSPCTCTHDHLVVQPGHLFRDVPEGASVPADPTDPRAAAEKAARDLLLTLASLPRPSALRVAEAEAGLACLILVWPYGEVMPTAGAERRRRSGGGRADCKADVVEVMR